MKRLLIGAVALTLLSGSAALAAPNGGDHRQDNNHGQQTAQHDQRGGQHWGRGQRLPSNYRTTRYRVDYRSHHLRAPPRGYQWVQVNNDYLLVALTTGLISQIIAGH